MDIPEQPNNDMERYFATAESLREGCIEDIQKYITDNKMVYTCNSEDFILGLTLGLKVGMERMYGNLTGFTVPYSNTDAIKLYTTIQSMKNE